MFKTPIQIMIIDDEMDFVEMLALRLEERGHEVRRCYTGEEGLEALTKAESDVIILDIKMPGMDGITALKKIKNDHPLVEVILLTGHGAVDTAVAGMKQGAYDYLLKPAQFDELLEKLDGARKRRFNQQERIRRAEARGLVRRTGGI